MVSVLLLAYIAVNLCLQSQGHKIQPAKIFGENKEVHEGGKLEVSCSAFGLTKNTVYFYLCKDGRPLDMQYRLLDASFKIESVEMHHSGNYSCVFSEEKLEMAQVMGYGLNYVFINVTELNTHIYMTNDLVPLGSDAKFICSISNPLNKTQSKNLILAYLIKNEKPIKVNIWEPEETKTIFTIREVKMEDAGTYSCAVLLNVLPYEERRFEQNNKVDFQITVSSYSITNTVIITLTCCVILLLILLTGTCTLIRKRGCVAFHRERSPQNETEIRRTEVFYEEIPKIGATAEMRSVVCDVSEWEVFPDYDEAVPYNK